MSKTIAIVEDDADQRGNYAHALQAQGYAIHQYANRQTALDGFDRALPDLAILDIMLEDEMDGGFDLCRDLRQRSPHMPIIFLTARDSDVDRVSGLRLDAWDYITKPVNLQFLAVRVASLFRIAETLQADSARPSALSIGELALDQNTMSVSWRGGALNLTLTEFWLIEAAGAPARACQNLRGADADHAPELRREEHHQRLCPPHPQKVQGSGPGLFHD